MKEVKVIHTKNLPFKMPLGSSIILGLLLDRLQAPDLAWGIAITVTAIYWILWIVSVWTREYIDIFNDRY